MHAIASDRPGADWTQAMRRGDYAAAWAFSQATLAQRDPATRDDPRLPYHLRWVWDGTPPDGRDVLVRCYHGLGDTLQFARYLPELARRAASVTLEVQPRLACLFGKFPCRVVPFDDARPLPPSECDIEIMELAFALRMAPQDVCAPWCDVSGFAFAQGTVGLCLTAGGWDAARSVPAQILAATPLQRPCIALDLGRSPLAVINPGGCPEDIAATAALVAGCDIVVTVDTMIAHLAGVMGKPVYLMLKHAPDWRWAPETGRSDWYPTVKPFAQPEPGAWEPVVDAIRAEVVL